MRDALAQLVQDLTADIGKTQTREAYLRATQRALEAERILHYYDLALTTEPTHE